jgi:hypothetical protein
MADIFDELIGGGAPPQELVSVLRRQRALGQIGALSGDKNIARMGGATYDDSMKQATDIRDRRDSSAARQAQQQLAMQQQEMASADRKSQRDYQYTALKQAGDIARQQMANARDIAGLKNAAGGKNLSPFEKERERKIAGESVAWDTAGKVQSESARSDIAGAIAALEQDKDIGDSWLSSLPGDEWIRSKLDPKGLEVQRMANRVTVENLRNTFGAAFTEKEGAQFKALDYDPALGNEQNLTNLKKKLQLIDAHTRRKNELFGQYRPDDMPNYGAPDTLTDDDLLRAIMAQEE